MQHIFAIDPLKIRLRPARIAACFSWLLWSGPLIGCGGSALPEPSARPSATLSTKASPQLTDAGWGVVRSARLGLKLALPEWRSWLDNGRTGGGWELRHEPTGTTLSIRRWRASRLPQVEVCAAELRQRTPLLEADETSLVARRMTQKPEGFLTRIEVIAAPGKVERFRGYVLAVGAGVGECLTALVVTESSSNAELAERLRLLDAALARMRGSQIEDRVRRAPPATP